MIELPNANDWIVRNSDPNSLERIEAFFTDHAYESHRHDTFAIGRTLIGVQSFHYRGEMKHSLPGMTMVLHPDEKHDGESGTRDGFRYRMVYVEPATLQEIMKGKPLPFFENGLSQDPRLFKATDVLLQGMDQHIDPLKNKMLYMIWQPHFTKFLVIISEPHILMTILQRSVLENLYMPLYMKIFL